MPSTRPLLHISEHSLLASTPEILPLPDMREIACVICGQHVPQNEYHRHCSRHILTPQREPARQRNAFLDWWEDTGRDSPDPYTMIDGQRRGPGLQAHGFIQIARDTRETTKLEVIKIVQEFKGLSDSDKETCIGLVRDVPILPGLVAYIYTHLITCPPGWFPGWFFGFDWTNYVSDLRKEVKDLQAKGDLHCVLFYHMIKRSLVQILDATKVRPGQHTCNSELLDGTMLMGRDIQNLAALVALCITGPDKDKILHAKGEKAAMVANLLHALLDAGIDLGEWCRRCLLDALISLSKETGHCPPGLYLSSGTLFIDDLAPRSQGGFGLVRRGTIGSRLVAVKSLKRDEGDRLDDYKKDLCKEAIIWRHLRHPNCLPLYGVYVMNEKGESTMTTAMVSPWMSNGTLFNYLEREPKANRTILILDMVRGLNYLHSMRPHVAHRDIKPDNILVTEKGRACLADFGFVSVFDTDPQFHTAPAQLKMGGTPNYMAPEIFSAVTKEDKRKVNKRLSDMYALGGTIYATYTGRPPFGRVIPEMIPGKVAIHQRPQFPEGQISLDMWAFIQKLWDPVPGNRLTAERTLAWMEFKAAGEGLDTSPPSYEEEWHWKGSWTQTGPLSVA